MRKEPKGRGTNRMVEGSDLGHGRKRRVLLVEDVVTTGRSLLAAYEAVSGFGGVKVVGAVALVERGGTEAADFFASKGIFYRALVHAVDLGLEPVA